MDSTCFFCSELIPPGTAKCPHCGEVLGKRAALAPVGWGSPEKPMSTAVFGWLNAIFGAFGLVGALLWIGMFVVVGSNAMLNQAWGVQSSGMQLFAMVSTGLGAVSSVVHVLSGYGLLRMRPWGRTLALGLAVYTIIASVITPLFTAQMMLENAPTNGTERTIMLIAIFAGPCLSLIYPALMLYFLSRPHVAAALRTAAERRAAEGA